MFSQLCRARPRTLWSKSTSRQPAVSELCSVINASLDVGDAEHNGDSKCQLEHCKFCDYRFCCQGIPCSPNEWETDYLEPGDSKIKKTENPAYGLSSKKFLEIVEEKSDEDSLNGDMEQSDSNFKLNEHTNQKSESLQSNPELNKNSASQKNHDCDDNTVPMKMYELNIPAQSSISQDEVDSKSKNAEELIQHLIPEANSPNETKPSGLTWSVLKHRQMNCDVFKNCDKLTSRVIEHSFSDTINQNAQTDSSTKVFQTSSPTKSKRSIKDRSFPLSLMKPIAKIGDKIVDNASQQFSFKNDLSRQCQVQRVSRQNLQIAAVQKEISRSKKFSNDFPNGSNPLSEIAQIKTEESIQEWLARIGESAPSSWHEDSEKKSKKGKKFVELDQRKLSKQTDDMDDFSKEMFKQVYQHDSDSAISDNSSHVSQKQTHEDHSEQDEKYDLPANVGEIEANTILGNASKASPANIPMVVMQCSRLHSHIGCKPPFQQTSLPMGTLVTGLYQESDWLYVQTPHGVEGFLLASNCASIGTICDPASTSRRPWEPCDFPIQISNHKKGEFGRQHGTYIPAKLPPNGKQAVPYVSTVKMKTNFYSDRYFCHTFKSKDSIKTAKTVTDILRSSPETKVSNQ